MRILLLGGTGFIGPFVARRLSAEGHEVMLFHRGQTQADLPPAVRHIAGDRRELPLHRAELARLVPDVVLDMYAMTAAEAGAVVAVFSGVAGRIVAISSQDVYRAFGRLIRTEPGPPDPLPLAEDAPLREKLFPYRGETPLPADDPRHWTDDYDKILVERAYLGARDLPGTILRLPMVYGPGDGQHRLFAYLKRMDDGRATILLGEHAARWRWTRGYVENVAAAIARATTDARAAGRVYNVGEEPALALAEWVRRIGAQAGWQGQVVTLPEERLPAHLAVELDLAQDLVADTARLRTELGYREAVPQDEALRRTIAWERANPPTTVDPARFDYVVEDAALTGAD